MAKAKTKEDAPSDDGRAQNPHDATAGKGDTSLSVLGNQSASVYDLQPVEEDGPDAKHTERQEGRSTSAHAEVDKTTLSVMGDHSESVYDKPEAEADAGYVGGLQALEAEQLPEVAQEVAADEGEDVARVGETEQENLPPAA